MASAQLSFFEEPAQQQANPQQPKATTAAKRIAPTSQIRIVQPQPSITLALYGLCRVCGWAIALPGLDASLCSNPTQTCGSGGWVTNPRWLAATPLVAKGK